jgi:hypothetical protein
MHYPCLAEPIANDDGYSLVSFREVDALLIARWRNEQMRVLRQSRALTDESQMRYFREIIVPSMSDTRQRPASRALYRVRRTHAHRLERRARRSIFSG